MAEVLLLADEPSLASLLRDLLEMEGHQVVVVSESEHGLIQLRATLHPIVALLMEMPLGPTLAGLLTTLHAERQELAPHACIVVTHYPDLLRDGIPQVLAELGVLVIVPPFDVYKLLAEVQRLAGRFPERWQ